MAVNRVVLAALVAILVTTTPAQAADAQQVQRYHRFLRFTAYITMFYTGLFAAVTLQPAMTAQETPNSTSALSWIKDFNAIWGFDHTNASWPNQAKVTQTLCILIFTVSTISVVSSISLLSTLHPLRTGQLVDFDSLHFRLTSILLAVSYHVATCLALLVWIVASGVPKDEANRPDNGSPSHLRRLMTLTVLVYSCFSMGYFFILMGIRWASESQ